MAKNMANMEDLRNPALLYTAVVVIRDQAHLTIFELGKKVKS